MTAGFGHRKEIYHKDTFEPELISEIYVLYLLLHAQFLIYTMVQICATGNVQITRIHDILLYTLFVFNTKFDKVTKSFVCEYKPFITLFVLID